MRNVLTEDNVKILAQSIHLYMNSIRDKVMFKSMVDIEIGYLIENMIVSEEMGEANLQALENKEAVKLEQEEKRKQEILDDKRYWEVEKLKNKAMLN